MQGNIVITLSVFMNKNLAQHLLWAVNTGRSNFLVVVTIVWFASFSSSCIPAKNLKYFNNLSDSQVVHLPDLQKPKSVIMPDDILDIILIQVLQVPQILLTQIVGTLLITKETSNFLLWGKYMRQGFPKKNLKTD
jgi:hypothetical protein